MPFIEVTTPEPHRARARALLRRHPEVRALFAKSPLTAPVAVALAIGQVAVAVALAVADAPLWLVFAAAYGLGAFVSHALYAVLHECAHQLVFARRPANRLLALFANLPLGVPIAIAYAHHHLRHHQRLGEYDADPDLPSHGEVRFAGRGFAGKLAWQLCFPLLQLTRTMRMRDPAAPGLRSGWLLANVGAQLAFGAALAGLARPAALGYLLASFYFTMALHPLAGRFVQEHFVVAGAGAAGQETSSYYGALNAVSLNVGYHNEHHDFPGIPWTRLPRLRALAPEVYGALASHRSWAALWWRFLTDPRLTLAARVVRGRSL